MTKDFFTVKEFNQLVHTILNETIGEATIKGEISGYKTSQGKWAYFDLKDEDSVLNCFCPLFRLDFPLSDGQEVLVTGTPGVYIPSGRFSFTVKSIQLQGAGALQKAFEELKNKLANEGLFDDRHKRSLPRFPERVGIITSGEGAAINDIKKVISGRWGGLDLRLLPVAVQGKNAPDELVAALDYFNQYEPVDVILFGRGGGSLEDLQAFNSERVARAIFASRIPIVSGVGHEHNTSIADLVADMRAATPSNAAELAIPDRQTIAREIAMHEQKAAQSILTRITQAKHHVERSKQTLHLFVQSRLSHIQVLINRVRHYGIDQTHQIQRRHELLSLLQQKVTLAMDANLKNQVQRLNGQTHLLAALNPTAILARGYSITYRADTNTPITQLADVPPDGRIKTQLQDGTIDSTVGVRAIKPLPKAPKTVPTDQPTLLTI